MRRAWWTLAAGIAAVVVAMGVQVAQAAVAGESPPENIYVKVIEPSGPPLWIDFIGSGSGGDSPLRDSIKQLIADGFYLRSDGTCGQTKARACVVIGP